MTPDISSPANPKLKAAVKLRDRAARREQHRFLIEGRREVERAMLANKEIVEVFVEERHAANFANLSDEVMNANGAWFTVGSAAFEKLAFGDRTDGIVAVAKTWDTSLARLSLPESPLVAVVEGVEKPGNLGAILRTADAAGVSAVIATEGGTDWFNPNAVRASLGALFSVPVAAGSTDEVITWLRHRGLNIFATRVDGAELYSAADYRGPTAIVLGSEAEGLSANWNSTNSRGVFLPMLGQVDSLNVSATAAVLFYEAWRQRNT